MSTSGNPFSAADSALGYLYQVRVALLWALCKLPAGADFLVSVETLDDVTFEITGGTPQELLQTKHHRTKVAALTDSSPDLWKTIRIWFEADASGQITTGTALHLLTTGTAPPGSAAAYLRTKDRNVDAALAALEATAQSSDRKSNKKAYDVFLKTPSARRRAVFDSVVVLDSAPTMVELDQDLRTVVFSAVERKNLDAFLGGLEGWWTRRVIRQLTTSGDRILAEEIESQMSDLREQFKQEALPIDDDLLHFMLDEATTAAHADSLFVRQIELTKAGALRIAAAIRDYYRAFEQRSRWLRHELLFIGDLDKYQQKLIEEWELEFATMTDELGAEATEEIKEKAARSMLHWAEQAVIPIRPRVTEPFVTRGSLHMLADDMNVGWHPEFKKKLEAILMTKGVA